MKNNIQRIRKKSGHTTKETAEQLGISEENYISKENGTSEFTLYEAAVLSELFSATISEMYGIEERN